MFGTTTHLVLGQDGLENMTFAWFLELTVDKQFVQQVVCLVEVEDYIQLAHVAEISARKTEGGETSAKEKQRMVEYLQKKNRGE